MPTVLIKNGRVFCGEKFLASDVLINDSIIETIEPNINAKADFVFDARGLIVSPGNIDIHAHIRHINTDKYGAPADAVCLPFGVTAVVDSAAEKGDYSVAERFCVNTLCFAAAFVSDDNADFTVTEKMIAAYREKCIGVKIFFDTANENIKTIKPLKQVCDFARKKGLKVMVHSTNSPVAMERIVDTLSNGDIITHAFHGGKNTIEENSFAAYRKAKEKGVVLDLAPAGFTHIDYSLLKRAIDKGFLPDTISTDLTKNSAMKRGGRYSLTMCMNMCRELGMSEEEVFRAVTHNAAKACGKADEWGILKPGGRADVAVFEYNDEGFNITDKFGNHIESDKGYRCVLTIVNGEILYRR